MIDLSGLVETLNNKPVAVFGLGVSGQSTVKALVSAGVSVTAWDDKKENRQSIGNVGAKLSDLLKVDLSDFAFLVLAPGVPYSFEPHPLVVKAQNESVEIICDIELFHRCGHEVKTIGITGTNGKSTTTALITHVLKEMGLKATMAGNIGKAIFDLNDVSDLDVLVLELSSYQLDLCPSFRPDVSLLLNITPDHLDRHGSMQAYIDAKSIILEGEGVAFIGVDDDFTQVLFERYFIKQNRKIIPISVKSKIVEGYFVKDNKLYKNHHGEDDFAHDFEKADYLNLKGLHNQQNASFAYAVSKELGYSDELIFKAFHSYAGLAHRQYLIEQKNNVFYVNDSKATNAEATAKALSSYSNIYWIVGGQSKEGGLEGLEIFKDSIVKAYVVGEAVSEFSAWLEYYRFKYDVSHTIEKATVQAHEDALSSGGDATVLLSPACASWDQFASFEKRGDKFTEIVKELVSV